MTSTKQSCKVIIIGAGIAGLTAAHLLVSAGCDVTIIEQSDEIGGQAKSGYNKSGFPTEHSLRVVHNEYFYLFEILKILQKQSYLDEEYNLSQFDLLTSYKNTSILFKRGEHSKIRLSHKIVIYFKLLKIFLKIGIKLSEIFIIIKVMLLWRMSSEELIKKYDQVDAATLLQIKDLNQPFYNTIFKIAQTLGAAKTDSSSILVLKLLELGHAMVNNIHSVKMFNGPSSEALFKPWKDYLLALGLTIITKKEISHLKGDSTRILSCHAEDNSIFLGDFYVLAVNYHQAKHILAKSNLLEQINFNINILDKCFQWSNGSQFYFSQLPNNQAQYYYPGLVTAYLDSPWSLVTVIQGRSFWKNFDKIGENLNILSVTYTNANTNGVIYDKPLTKCTSDEIKNELLAQCGIKDQNFIDWHLDDALKYISNDEFQKSKAHLAQDSYSEQDQNWLINTNLLFTPIPGYYGCAPNAKTPIENLYLAGEYCQTHYKIPTMEKACESGFHAANQIFKKLNLSCITPGKKGKSHGFN